MVATDRRLALLLTLGCSLVYLLMSAPFLFDPFFWMPDADRIRMDGIFLLDWMKDLPGSLFNLYDYTITYYAKYPSLSIGYRPPFYAFIESIFFAGFGVSTFAAKLATLFFLNVGIYFWLRLAQETHDTTTAFLSLLLWITNPLVFKYSQSTMLEIPTLSMTIISIYCLHKYLDSRKIVDAVYLGLAVGLSLWTNQKAAFLLLTLMLYPILSGKIREMYLNRRMILWGGIVLTFLIPLAIITLWLGDQNLAQSIGTKGGSTLSRPHNSDILKNIHFIYENHFIFPLVFLLVIGMGAAIIRRSRETLIYASVILSIYLFFTLIKIKVPRYSMYWIPFFCLFAAIGAQQIAQWLGEVVKATDTMKRVLRYGIFILPVFFQLVLFPGIHVGRVAGFERAAKYVLANSTSPVVFVHGYAHSQFIYFMRAFDPERRFVIVRGDKLIASSSISYHNRLQIHLQNKSEMAQALSELGAQFMVIESFEPSKIEAYVKLRQLLRDHPSFILRKTIPLESNYSLFKDKSLLIYENLERPDPETDTILKLRLPVVGQTITMPLEKIVPTSNPSNSDIEP